MLHLGMSSSDYWRIEKIARRDGYDWVGDDGIALPKHNGGKGETWEGLPEELMPVFDVEGVAQQLHDQLSVSMARYILRREARLAMAYKDIPTDTSRYAGLMYCEFIFYTSLATLHRRNDQARVEFLHHPGKKTAEEDIQKGADVAQSVICSMIDQLRGM